MTWVCVKCETSNIDSADHCEVCDLERLYTKPEVADLLSATSPAKSTEFGPNGATSFASKPPKIASKYKSNPLVSISWIALILILAVVVTHFVLDKNSGPQVSGGNQVPIAQQGGFGNSSLGAAVEPTVIVHSQQAEVLAREAAQGIDHALNEYYEFMNLQSKKQLTVSEAGSERSKLQAEFEDSLKVSQQALDLDISSSTAWVDKCTSLLMLKQYETNKIAIDQALARFPNNKDLIELRAKNQQKLRGS